MEISKAKPDDLGVIMEIYRIATAFMQSIGNTTQWVNGYPSEELVRGDIAKGHSYLCIVEGRPVGVFYFAVEEEPTYAHIEDGNWLDEKPYGVVHRIASDGTVKGVGAAAINWCFGQCGNLRIDTHRDNAVMQNLMSKLGFAQCGIIYVEDGSERLAYHKNK